jgi:hypothetical protein
MPVLYQQMIYRSDLERNPDAYYLFGDNDRRSGRAGQAGEMRGEDNAIGVRTKWAPDNREASFFSDKDAEEIMVMITEDLAELHDHLRDGGIVVIPADGLGTGLSQLPERAPQVNAFLEDALQQLEGE